MSGFHPFSHRHCAWLAVTQSSTMDGTTVIISGLLDKLAELEEKVNNYRQDMAQEFRRFSHDLLHDVPEQVSIRVEEALADKLHKFPVLGPAVALNTASADLGRSAVGRWARCGRVSPPPVLPHTSGVPPNDGSPPDRDRDREFHGLFTPSFLPLLEVMPPNQSAAKSTAPLLPALTQDTPFRDTRESSPHVQLDAAGQPPGSARHWTTEETTAPIALADKGSHARRSALRRSSSGSAKDIHGPRRVRFDVEGEEVLPTSSPPILPLIHDLATSPLLNDPAAPICDALGHIIVFDEEASALGTSPPRPKKISSTERLKALARNSTEDTSNWTVVGETHDDDEDEEEGLVMFSPRKRSKAPCLEQAPIAALKNGTGSPHPQDIRSNPSTRGDQDNRGIGKEAGNIPELASPTPSKGKERLSPPLTHRETAPEAGLEGSPRLRQVLPIRIKSPGSSLLSPPRQGGDTEEEAMFKFEDDGGSLPQVTGTPAKYIEEEEEESETEQQIELPTSNSPETASTGLLSRSPAIPIAKPASLPATSAISSSWKQAGASAGSYKGTPFMIGVVRNEEVYRKAAEMGDFKSFVGSVDGRSGMDESDQHAFGGTPRSLGERLMAEAHARRRAHSVHQEANRAHKQADDTQVKSTKVKSGKSTCLKDMPIA